MNQSIPKPPIPPPGQSPGIWLALSSVQWGIWGRPVGHLTFVSKRLSVVWNKRISQFFDSAREPHSQVIGLVDSTWGFLLFYIVISWNMPLFKAWRLDKLNKKFVVLKILQNLFPKVSDSVYIRLFHECMAWQGGGFDPLWSSNGWGIWLSQLAT